MSEPTASRRLWKWKILKAVAHGRRHPYFFAIIGFSAGLASFLLVDRQEKTAGIIAVLMLTVTLALPSIIQMVPLGGPLKGAGMVGIVLLLAVVAWMARPAVPPATLWLTDSTITHVVDKGDLTAGRSLRDPGAGAVLERGLYAYTAIRAPRGLNETVYHEWIHEGRTYDRIPLEVTGGRKAGYRAWTHKMAFPVDPVGQWRVRVTTESGQMLGEIRFRVSE